MTMSLADSAFSPSQVHGNRGDQVTIIFRDAQSSHTFTVPELGIDERIAAGSTLRLGFVVRSEGVIPFYCRLHGAPGSGMHGYLVFH
jgi:plastocyanin